MKKTLLLLISLSVIGCSSVDLGSSLSSLELGDALSTEDEANRILALGLSHEENLKEASKLDSPHKISVVTLKLINARDEKIQYDIDLIESAKLVDQVIVSNNGLKIVGSNITESLRTGMLETDSDLLNYFIEGTKDYNDGNFQHNLNLAITHNSKNKREYLSAVFCDEWGRCEGDEQKLITISSMASNCSSTSCDYKETMELELSEVFLKNMINKGFTMKLISKKKNHKIKVSKPYLMSYLSYFN